MDLTLLSLSIKVFVFEFSLSLPLSLSVSLSVCLSPPPPLSVCLCLCPSLCELKLQSLENKVFEYEFEFSLSLCVVWTDWRQVRQPAHFPTFLELFAGANFSRKARTKSAKSKDWCSIFIQLTAVRRNNELSSYHLLVGCL